MNGTGESVFSMLSHQATFAVIWLTDDSLAHVTPYVAHGWKETSAKFSRSASLPASLAMLLSFSVTCIKVSCIRIAVILCQGCLKISLFENTFNVDHQKQIRP